MVAMKNVAYNVMALAAAADAYTASTPATQYGCWYNIPNVGTFNTRFNALSSTFGTLQDIISSVYTVAAGNSPFARRFDLANMGSGSDGALTLTVPGGQSSGPISTAQLITSYSDIIFGSVRTVAMVSNVPGTTHGFSFYANDNQEIDFASITSNISQVHLTNEQVSADAPSTSYTAAAPADAATAYHEYRVDWTANQTSFYIDSVLIQTITDNVPTTAGFWLWNNWSNGNSWAQGPPTADSVLKILSIDAYFNRTSVASANAINPICAFNVLPKSSSTASSSSTSSSSVSSSSSASSVTTSSAKSSITSSSSISSSSTSSTKTSTTSTSSTSTCATPTSTPFYIKNSSSGGNNGYYAVVANGNGVGLTFTASTTASASKFYTDCNGHLVEITGTAGNALELSTSSSTVQRVYFDSLSATGHYGYATCSITTGQLVCQVNNAFYYAVTCLSDTYMYFGLSYPSYCQYVSLVPVSVS